MQLIIHSRTYRNLLLAVEMGVFVFLTGWIAKVYIATVLARQASTKRLRLAIKMDPGNEQYHLMLGRLYMYAPTEYQPEKALSEFRTAVRLSPFDPEAWLNLGEALELEGKVPEADECLRTADLLAPKIPLYQWSIANFYLLHGNVDESFRHFRVVLAGTREFDQVIFRTVWKASGDAQKILREVIPEDLPAELGYLYYLISEKRLPETKPPWKRIMNSPSKFDPQRIRGYIDALIGSHDPTGAYDVWSDLQRKGLIPNLSPESQNLIQNGDFEDELLNMGFGWQVVQTENVYAGRDTSAYHSPSHALLVQFPGKQNFDYANVFQYVKVAAGQAYRLQVFMKTEGITTNSGPRLEVRDAYDPGALDKLAENMTGTSTGWVQVILDFTTGPRTDLIVVSIRRLPSQKFDNLISGRVWLDDVRLISLPAE